MRFTLLSLIAISLSVSAQDYGTLHYSEEFNDNSNNWSVEKNEKIEPSIKDGNYVIEHKVEDRSYFLFNRSHRSIMTSRIFLLKPELSSSLDH